MYCTYMYVFSVNKKYCFNQTVGSTLGWSQFTKGHNSVKTVDGVMVLNLFISSDDALYLHQVSRKYLIGFQSY